MTRAILAALALLCITCAAAPRHASTLPVPDGCAAWPALPLSVALDWDMDVYQESYDEAMNGWNQALGRPAFRWARPGEVADVTIVQGYVQMRNPWQMAVASTRCFGGRFTATITHNHVLDVVEAYYFAEHELGHVLGVGHSANPASVMHPVLPVGLLEDDERMPVYWIMDDDVAAARSIHP